MARYGVSNEVHEAKRNVRKRIACVASGRKSIPQVHLYAATSRLLRCNLTWCFLANYAQPLPSALMRQQLPGQFVFSCFSLTIRRTSRKPRALVEAAAFSLLFFFLVSSPEMSYFLFLFLLQCAVTGNTWIHCSNIHFYHLSCWRTCRRRANFLFLN